MIKGKGGIYEPFQTCGPHSLVQKSREHQQKFLTRLHSEGVVVGLTINVSKSKLRLNKHAGSTLFNLSSKMLEQ